MSDNAQRAAIRATIALRMVRAELGAYRMDDLERRGIDSVASIEVWGEEFARLARAVRHLEQSLAGVRMELGVESRDSSCFVVPDWFDEEGEIVRLKRAISRGGEG